jgi:hypothetical protein
MPAHKIRFVDYKKHPTPRRVYLDSNFALHLLYYDINKANPTVLDQTDIDCFNFHQQLLSDGVELVGSVYTFSEVLQVYTFTYDGGMYDLTDQFLNTHGHAAILSKPKHNRFKYFLKHYPTDCENGWKTISYRVAATEDLFDQYKMKLIHPLPSPQLTNVSRDVISFASILKDFFVGLEANDALHLSIATYLNSDAVVSLDAGMLAVDNFTIYAQS